MLANLSSGVKICSSPKCHLSGMPQPFSAFGKRRRAEDGMNHHCRECCKRMGVEQKDRWRKQGLCYRCGRVPECGKTRCSRCIQAGKDQVSRSTWTPGPDVRSRRRIKHRLYARQKLATDIQYRLKNYLRSRVYQAVRTRQRSGSAVCDLGCSIAYFMRWVAQKFQPGMSWSNHGEWELDHIVPLSAFDLTDREQFLKAVHYTNYQPLWALDNKRKGGYRAS